MKFWIINSLLCLLFLPGFGQNGRMHYQITKDLELIQLSQNAYLHVSWSTFSGYGRVSCNGLLFTNQGEALLFDTPATQEMTMTLVNWLSDSLKIKIVGFVPNHWHSDCMGGLAWLQQQKIKSYASWKTIEIAKKNKLPIPDHHFKDSLQLSLGNQQAKCYYLGPAHTLDNIVVWIPSEKILFAGCMVKCMESDNLGFTGDGDMKNYTGTLRKVLAKFPEAKIVIPGHDEIGGLELIKHTLEIAERNK